MADIVAPDVRSRMMAGIKSAHTVPEVTVRRILHHAGFRFRLHRKDLSGKPDLVLPKYRLAVFVHGCFWHGHENCPHFRLPESRQDFWQEKIGKNRDRDRRNIADLQAAGWRTMVVWECAMKPRARISSGALSGALSAAVVSERAHEEIRGPALAAPEGGESK